MANSVAALAPAWMDGVQVNAAQMRREILGGLYDRAGIVRGLTVSALPTPAMKLRLPAGLCVVDDGQSGYYPLANSTQVDLDIAPSSATQPRIDSLIAQVLDNGDATSTYLYRILTGTPASVPSPPALPPADAPGAYTLRVANAYVQAAAETNGFIRAQDVTIVAPSAMQSLRPRKSDFVSPPGWGSTSTWVDFTSAQWPPITMAVPASGAIKFTISGGNMSNTNTDVSSIRISYRVSGANTISVDPLDSKAVLACGNASHSGSRTTYIDGLTPGGAITITPMWRISSGSSSTVTFSAGQLLAEPVA
ncbi:hypothetical protein [Actinoallomurus sp. CA-142502]|uniref:hypothetical protein n=1 Tax=Actinoallomurus sp. CA-142502 TaxID=3239885 RepID=UPI003D8F399D